jgi:integrase
MYVYQNTRKVNGRKVRSKLWRGRYRLPGDCKETDVSLETTDKEVAKAKLRRIVSEAEREREGLLAPKKMRETAQLPLTDSIEAFLAERNAVGRDEKYIHGLRHQLETLSKSCGWKRASDVTADSFCAWRKRQKKSAKTLNEYLTAAVSLLSWLMRHGKVAHNPLAVVEKVATHGEKLVRRRAYTSEELVRLLAIAGPRRITYLTAVKTGLRRGELQKLAWPDLSLDVASPFIRIRACIAKGRKETQQQPIDLELAEELRKLRVETGGSGRVFAGRIPRMERMRADLKTAKIPFTDAEGRRADFHALRLTFQMLVSLSGAAPRVAMELMRHSDIKLTMKTYTDSSQLPLRKAIEALPSLLGVKAISHTAHNTGITDIACREASRGDAQGSSRGEGEIASDEALGRELAQNGTSCHSREMVRGAGFEPATFRV